GYFVDQYGQPDPREDPERGSDCGDRGGLGEELAQYVAAPRAEGLPQADLASPFRDRHQHDVHDHDAADDQRHEHDARDDGGEDRADAGPESLDAFRGVEHEIVVLLGAQMAPAAHDPLGLLDRLTHFDVGPRLPDK